MAFGPSIWREPWTLGSPAFRIAPGLFYVGNDNVSCHLLHTAEALVLIDTAFAQTAYLLTESMRELGFRPADLDLILHTHGPVDHAGATRRMQELSGAQTAMGEADVETVEQGTPMTCAEYFYGMDGFETFTVGRVLGHGDVIDCGDTEIVCHHTPGHTPGVITFTFGIEVDGRAVTAGLFGGPGVWTLRKEHCEHQGYPGNREDMARSLEYVGGLDVELWLGAHPSQNDTFGKRDRLRAGESPNPFLDLPGWRDSIERVQRSLQTIMDEEP